MLSRAHSLRVPSACFGRLGSRNRGRHASISIAELSRSRTTDSCSSISGRSSSPHNKYVPHSRSGVVLCSHLHSDANRRRRQADDFAPPVPRATLLSGLVGGDGKRLALERDALAAMASAQRATLSSAEGGGAGGVGSKSKAEQAQAGMDAETRRSIGEGDKKSKKSLKTVKVSHNSCNIIVYVHSSIYRLGSVVVGLWHFAVLLYCCVYDGTAADRAVGPLR